MRTTTPAIFQALAGHHWLAIRKALRRWRADSDSLTTVLVCTGAVLDFDGDAAFLPDRAPWLNTGVAHHDHVRFRGGGRGRMAGVRARLRPDQPALELLLSEPTVPVADLERLLESAAIEVEDLLLPVVG